MNLDQPPSYLNLRTAPLDVLTPEDEKPEMEFVLPDILPPAKAVPVASTFDAAGELETVTDKAFKKLNEILDLPLTTAEDKEFATLLRVQMTAVQTVLNTNVRVDEQRMKRRQSDNLGALLEVLSKHEKKMPTIIQVEM